MKLGRMALAAVVGLAMTAGAWAQEPPKQDGKKKGGAGPLGLPAAADLKDKCGFDDEQVKKADEVYASFKDKAAEASKKVVDAGQDKDKKKTATGEVKTLKGEIVAKLKEVCKDDEQKKKLDEATGPPKKKV